MDLKKSDFNSICRFCLKTNSNPIPIFPQINNEDYIKEETDGFLIRVPVFISSFTNLTVYANELTIKI